MSECVDRLKASGRADSVFLDMGLAETLVWRERGTRLDVRFKRAMVRVLVHNWFRLTFAAGSTGTRVDVEERFGLGRGWWATALLGAGFFGIFAAFSQMPWTMAAFMTVLLEAVALVFGAVVSAFLTDRDRRDLVDRLERILDARPAAQPAVAGGRGPRLRSEPRR